MAVSLTESSSLELTISIPGFATSSPSRLSSVESCGVRNLDINRVPATEEEEEEEESSNGGRRPLKKLRLSKEQSRLLEESFRSLNHTLNSKQKEALAMELKLKPRQVEVWFQNRRARSKLKQTEFEYEYLKRWFGSLTEQNRRLRREVAELRAVKVAPPAVISRHGGEPLPASSLTMCPRCQRLTAAAAVVTPSKVALTAVATRQPSATC